MDYNSGGSCCESPKTGHRAAAEAGNRELTLARTVRFACSSPELCLNHCERIRTMGLGGKKKKQKHKREEGKGM